jgi:hypothetical protein
MIIHASQAASQNNQKDTILTSVIAKAQKTVPLNSATTIIAHLHVL